MTSMAVWPEPSDNGAPLVLLAWEMGGGLGHVHPLLRVGRPLAERGYRMAMVVRNLVEPDVLLRHLPFPVPRCRSKGRSAPVATPTCWRCTASRTWTCCWR